MKILLVNQAFYPDVVATAQVLTDLARHLVREGHAVTVLTAATAYDDPGDRFPVQETWNDIEIIRVSAPRFSKRLRWSRLFDIAGHLTAFAARLATLTRFDVIVALTSPPLVSVLAAMIARLRGSRLVLWIMDLNPDEAVAAGWLTPDSAFTRMLDRLLFYSLSRADSIIALDRFMEERLVSKGVDGTKVTVIPPWSHNHDVVFSQSARESFRQQHDLDDRFTVMYAGNHSPCHPLETLLEAACQLRNDPGICFCFVGGGSGAADVRDFRLKHQLPNITQLPYQPREQLAGTLSAADLHVVAMGNPFVGIVHPCKVYNILRVGSPVLYIGPTPSHVADLRVDLPAGHLHIASHGNVGAVKEAILSVRSTLQRSAESGRRPFGEKYVSSSLLPQLTAQLAAVGASAEVPMRSSA